LTVTSEPQATAAETRASQHTGPLRELGALVLVAANAVFLFVGLLRLVPTDFEDTFTARAQAVFPWFVGFDNVALPLVAVLLVTHLGGTTPRARLITTVALAEYAFSAFFGVVFGFFVGLIAAAGSSLLVAVEEFLNRLAWLAVLGVAAFVVFTVWRKVLPPARATQQPAWGFPGAGPTPGQFGSGPSAQFGGAPTGGGFAAGPAGGQYAPSPGQPAPGGPYGPAAYGPPAGAGHGAFAEPTQAFGRQHPGQEPGWPKPPGT
jgi:hypothetical protein